MTRQSNYQLGVCDFLVMEFWKHGKAGSSVLKTIEYMQNWHGEFSWLNPDVCILSTEEETSMKICKNSENTHNETLERRM